MKDYINDKDMSLIIFPAILAWLMLYYGTAGVESISMIALSVILSLYSFIRFWKVRKNFSNWFVKYLTLALAVGPTVLLVGFNLLLLDLVLSGGFY